jgi:hypothetical protein
LARFPPNFLASMSASDQKVSVRPRSRKQGRQKTIGNRSLAQTFSAQSMGFPGMNTRFVEPIYQLRQLISQSLFFTTSTTLVTGANQMFTLNLIDQVAALTSVFDQYRIDEVEVWMYADNGAGTMETVGLYSAVDYDDVTGVLSPAVIGDFGNCVVSTLAQGHYRRFQPHIAVAAYSGAFTSFANEPAPWIDAASPAVQHYGFRAAADISPAGAYKVQIAMRLTVSLRNVR